MTSMREALAPFARQIGPYVRDHEILRVSSRLSDGDDTLERARNEVLAWAKKRVGKNLPIEAWEHRDFELNVAGRNISAVRIERGDVDIWALRGEDPDKNIAGRVWTTEVTLARDEKGVGRFAVRLLASSSESSLDILPASPGLVMQIAENCGLLDGTHQLGATAQWVTDENHVERFIDLLLDPTRSLPIVALSCLPGEDYPLLDQDVLAKSLVGLAHVLVVGEQAAWRLTEQFGKVYSVHSGAARTYWPGFVDGCSPYIHRLLLADRLQDFEDRRMSEAVLRTSVAQASVAHKILGKDVLTFAEVKRASIQLRSDSLNKRNAAPDEQLAAVRLLAEAQDKRIKELEADLAYFDEEHRKAEDRATTAEQQMQGANARIEQLQTAMRARGQEPDAEVVLPASWGEFAEWCDAKLAGRVVLASKARRQTRDPKYEDFETAAQSLLWLANECRTRRIEGGAGSLADAPVLDSVRNAHCGGDTFQFDWQGRRLEADWHIKNGGNTRDPQRCLRIYYAWDSSRQLIVIAEMPAHVETAAT